MSLDEFCTGRSSGHLRLSRYVVSAMGQRAREEARIAPRVTFVNARRYVRVRIHTGIPTAADCSRVTRSCPGVTRDSLDFSHSLRGLSCLLQKHRLRYTIKSPAQFRGLAPLSSLFLSLLSSRAFLSPSLASLAHSSTLPFRSHWWLYPLSCHHSTRRSRHALVSCHATRYHRGKRRGHLVVALNYPRTTHISTLSPSLLSRSSFPVPSSRLRRAAFVNFYAFLVGNVVCYQRNRGTLQKVEF